MMNANPRRQHISTILYMKDSKEISGSHMEYQDHGIMVYGEWQDVFVPYSNLDRVIIRFGALDVEDV